MNVKERLTKAELDLQLKRPMPKNGWSGSGISPASAH